MQGTIKKFDPDRGFGFIAGDDGTSTFVHVSHVKDDVESLEVGQRVEYGVVTDQRSGKLRANAVRLLDDAPVQYGA